MAIVSELSQLPYQAMAAFAHAPVSLRHRTRLQRNRLCGTRREVYACAKTNGVVPPSQPEPPAAPSQAQIAIDSAAETREKLNQITEERREQAERVKKSIIEMNAALDRIMAKIEVETGGLTSNEATAQSKSSAGLSTSATVDEDEGSQGSSVASSSYIDSDAEPYMDPSTFGMDSTGGWQVLANSDALPISNAPVKFRIECDGSGCSIIEMEADAAPGPGVRQQFVHSGRGFRVGYDPEAPDSFCGMVGTDQWLLALDKQEMRHFKRLVTAVARKMARIDRGDEQVPESKANPAVRRSGDGMFNERVVGTDGSGISVEMESKLLWVQAVGKTKLGAYALRIIMMERRQSEGYWSADVVPSMLVAVAKLAVE